MSIYMYCTIEERTTFKSDINENDTDFNAHSQLHVHVQVIVSRALITNCPSLGCENSAQLISQIVRKRYHR